jgi:hypothetical protein
MTGVLCIVCGTLVVNRHQCPFVAGSNPGPSDETVPCRSRCRMYMYMNPRSFGFKVMSETPVILTSKYIALYSEGATTTYFKDI